MTPLKKLATCATTWLVIGLLGGVFYREFTKAHDFTGWTQLKVVHTHSLALGFMLTLIVLLVERAFALSHHRGAFAFLGIQPWPPADDRNARRARHDAGQRTSRRLPCDLRYCGSRPHRPVRRSRRPHGGPVHITSGCGRQAPRKPLTSQEPLSSCYGLHIPTPGGCSRTGA